MVHNKMVLLTFTHTHALTYIGTQSHTLIHKQYIPCLCSSAESDETSLAKIWSSATPSTEPSWCIMSFLSSTRCVCVCVCVREREREREEVNTYTQNIRERSSDTRHYITVLITLTYALIHHTCVSNLALSAFCSCTSSSLNMLSIAAICSSAARLISSRTCSSVLTICCSFATSCCLSR
jgi:hypothetical protein